MQALQKKLDAYLGSIEESPAQRSPEWYAIRKNTIGGSEISTVIGTNPFNSVKSLLAGKVGISHFNGNTACRWGTLFEHLTEKFTELALKMTTNIKEAGSVPGVFERQRYSPDGLGIVKLLNCDNDYEWYVILFEFKAPLGTLPNNKIPKHYAAQVQTGMISIPLTDYTIFVNNCYRKCALSDLDFSSVYDKEYHYGDYKKRKYGLEDETPFACGIICFYQTQSAFDNASKVYDCGSESEEYDISDAFKSNDDNIGSYYSLHDCDAELLLRDSLIDFGSVSKDMVNRMLELYDRKCIKAVYYPMLLEHRTVNAMPFIQTHKLESAGPTNTDPIAYAERCLERFEVQCTKKKLVPIGFLPWKLMRSNIILEPKDPEWYNTIKEPLEATLKTLNDLNQSADPVTAYYELYPIIDESAEYMKEVSDMTGFV